MEQKEEKEIVLSIANLTVAIARKNSSFPAVKGVNLHINKGELVALVGESGCGKSLTALSMMGLLPEQAQVSTGDIQLNGRSVVAYTSSQWNSIRGSEISMIFQEPMTALNPLMKVGKQIAESVKRHQNVPWNEAKKAAYEMLKKVGLADVQRIFDSYPHQLSGGMRQRIVIAIALVNRPAIVVADEPTTALDVTIQAQIMDLLRSLNDKTESSVLLITHDLGLVSHLCDRVYIMYAGEIVESGPVRDVIASPLHPYTAGLLASIPVAGSKNEALPTIPGTVPSLGEREYSSCLFYSRCARRTKECLQNEIPVITRGSQTASCLHALEGGALL